MCNSLTTLNIVQGRLWLLYLVRLKRDSFPQHLLSLQDVLQRPRAMRWYHAFQTSCVQIPAFFKLLVFKPQVVTLHLRIALPARQCTLLALRCIFDHSWLINIEKAKSTVQNVRCTIYPVHIAHAQQMSSLSNCHSEENQYWQYVVNKMSEEMENENILSNQCRISLVFLKTSTLGLQSPLRKFPFSRSLGECFCFSIVITQSSS